MSLSFVAVPCQAQDAQPAPGLQLRFPTFIVGADSDQAPPKEAPPQGGVSTPKPAAAAANQKTSLSKVILYGLQLTFYEHVMRVATQEFTRKELSGPFFQDWFDSVHVPDKWHDKDHWQVNYIGHAIHGGAFSRIWLEQREPPATSKTQYLKQISRAFVYTGLFSLQYEIGPMSEASIGNVGQNKEDVGWVDLVWTPVGSVLWTMGEDALDKYAITWVERHVPFMMAKAAARMIGNPSRMLANISQNRSPWSRYDRDWNGNKK